MLNLSEINNSAIGICVKNSDMPEIDICSMIVDCYNDNKNSSLSVFGWSNIYYSHYIYLKSKLSFYEKRNVCFVS